MKIHDETKVPEFLKMLSDLSSTQIEIGILGDGKGGSMHKGSKKITVLGIATVQEYGLTITMSKGGKVTIPERSFIRAGFDAEKADIEKQGEKLLNQVINLKLPVDAFYKAIGEFTVGKIQEYLTNLSSPANSPVTVAMKGSSNPLIDTGQLRDSIEYRLVKN